MQIVRIVNEDDKTFRGKYAGQWTTLKPGEEIMVPIEAAILWTGDPDTRDIDVKNKNRTMEYERLGSRYGCLGSLDAFREMTPKLGVFLQNNTRLVTVLEDPFAESGTSLQLTTLEPSEDNAGVRAMQMVQGLMDRLESRGIDVAALLAGEEDIFIDGDDSTDAEREGVVGELLDDADLDPDEQPVTTPEPDAAEVPRAKPVKKPAAKRAPAKARPVAPSGPRTDG